MRRVLMFMTVLTRRVALLLPLSFVSLAAAMLVQPAANFVPAQGSPFKLGEKPSGLVVADANSDGAPDLLAALSGNAGLGVLLGDGRGGFRPAPRSAIAGIEAPHLIVTADFNGDKKIDVALTSHDSNSATVLLGTGAGAFNPAPGSPFAVFSVVKPHNHGLAAGDLNGDGNPDLTLGHQDAGVIGVLLGDGRGGFAPATGSPFRIGQGFYPHALGDMNGDGRLDVVAPDILGSAIVVALGDGRGGFAVAIGSPVRVKSRPYFVLLDDVNGDRRLDAIATHDDMDDVDVLLGDGKGGLTARQGFRAGHRGWRITAADLNADGRKDLMIAGMDGLKAFQGSGNGEFAPSAEWSWPSSRATWQFDVADFNGDGKSDVAFIEFDGGTVSVMLHR